MVRSDRSERKELSATAEAFRAMSEEAPPLADDGEARRYQGRCEREGERGLGPRRWPGEEMDSASGSAFPAVPGHNRADAWFVTKMDDGKHDERGSRFNARSPRHAGSRFVAEALC